MSWRSSSPELFRLVLRHCASLRHVQQAHGFMVTRGLDEDNFLLGQLIEACSSLGLSAYAFSLFDKITHPPDIFLYNTVIKSLSTSISRRHQTLLVYKDIRRAGLRPDTYSFPFALRAVVSLSAGRQLHCQALVVGFDADVHVLTSLVQMYSNFRDVRRARQLFDETTIAADVPLWNAMLAGYAKLGDLRSARDLFERMSERNVISWTTLVAGYAQSNRPHEALAMFRRMQLANVEPDEIAMVAALSACAQLGALQFGEWIHKYIDKHGLHRIVPLQNALIDMYAKSGNIQKALIVFENTKHKSIVTWTTLIAGLALHGLGSEAIEMFARMERAHVKPNDITFIGILSACSHVGLVEIGHSFFNTMNSRYGIEPKIEHYGCMIDLLGRAGHLQEAQELLEKMPFQANAAIWGSLLASANTHGDAKLGELALHHLIKLEPANSGNYALLSNIYASLGRWNESRMVRKVMRDTGVKKMPGGSCIELNHAVHEFVAGQISHPQFDKIYELLYNMNGQLRLAKYSGKEYGAMLEFGDG